MLKAFAAVGIVVLALVWNAGLAGAQTSPAPGPTNPAPGPNPLAKPGANLVINPTTEECDQGWRPGLKWTREQFETFCAQLKTSK